MYDPIREAVTEVLLTLTAEEINELVMEPYRSLTEGKN